MITASDKHKAVTGNRAHFKIWQAGEDTLLLPPDSDTEIESEIDDPELTGGNPTPPPDRDNCTPARVRYLGRELRRPNFYQAGFG